MEQKLSQIVEEYRTFRETGRRAPAASVPAPGGVAFEVCTSDGRDFVISLVREPDGAVTPLALGSRLRRYESLLKEWEPGCWPSPSVVVDGASRVFMPAGMSHLVGVIQVGQAAWLLGVFERGTKTAGAIALLYINGQRITALHVGGPMDLRRIDVDQQLALQSARLKVQTGEAAAALLPAFARLLARSTAPNKRVGPRHRGKGSVNLFIWVLVRLARMGAEDLYGRLGDIERQIQAHLPGTDLPREALGDVLALMLDIRTCLVVRVKLMWHIRLAGLNDLESAIHKKFCAEAAMTVVGLDAAGRVCAPDAPPMRTKLLPRTRSPAIPCVRPAEGVIATDTDSPGAATHAPAADPPVVAAASPAADRPIVAEVTPPVAGAAAHSGAVPTPLELGQPGAAGAHTSPADQAPNTAGPQLPDRGDSSVPPDAAYDALSRVRAELAKERDLRIQAEFSAIKRGIETKALKEELSVARQAAARAEVLRPIPSEQGQTSEVQKKLVGAHKDLAEL